MEIIHSLFGTDPKLVLMVVLNLVLLESLLSVDNAVVLAVMVMKLKPEDRPKALSYGLLGAYVFRGVCLLFASVLYQIVWLKALGGLYLLWIAVEHFKDKFFCGNRGYYAIKLASIAAFIVLDQHYRPEVICIKILLALYAMSLIPSWLGSFRDGISDTDDADESAAYQDSPLYKFLASRFGDLWATVAMVEVMDLAFSIDNVFSAVALTDKLGLIYLGVSIGILTMRFASQMFVQLLEKFPALADAAFLIIGILGIKLFLAYLCETYKNLGICPILHSEHADLCMSIATVVIFVLPIAWGYLRSRCQGAST